MAAKQLRERPRVDLLLARFKSEIPNDARVTLYPHVESRIKKGFTSVKQVCTSRVPWHVTTLSRDSRDDV